MSVGLSSLLVCTWSAKGFSCSQCATSCSPGLRLITLPLLRNLGHRSSCRCWSLRRSARRASASTSVSTTTTTTIATWATTRTASNTPWLLDRSFDTSTFSKSARYIDAITTTCPMRLIHVSH
ncbi:unnamed protein product, partial [Ectocarpus sp. 6 AP-2014]